MVVLLLVLLFAIFQRPRRTETNHRQLTINDFLPSHHLQSDEIQERLAEHNAMLKKIEALRRDTAFSFVEAIRGDFFRLQHLLTRAAKFVPELTLDGEAHRFWIGINFRLECRLAQLQILLGLDANSRLKALTAKVRLLADCADRTLNEVARQQGLPTLESDLNS
ncbi:MAG TPA: hypothetical protein VGR94_03135 [Candidatus Acidoferrales bacterium]|nr:hypothetical protein [Candidatus Acidoferrales bacterium]